MRSNLEVVIAAVSNDGMALEFAAEDESVPWEDSELVRGWCSPTGRPKHLLETPFHEPLLRILFPFQPTTRHLLRALLKTICEVLGWVGEYRRRMVACQIAVATWVSSYTD